LGIAKTVGKIQENQEHGVELLNILSAKQYSVTKPISSSDTSISSSKNSDNPYCLWFWVVTCILCGFMAALFIAAVFIALIISLTDPVLEPQCEKVERQLSNGESSSWGVSSAAASIINQDENGTTLLMPCEGIALDEAGNEYQIDGAFKLVCNPPVSFNYVSSIVTWKTDHCCTAPKWKYDKRTYGYSSSEAAGCSLFCNNHCKSSVTCEYTPVDMELCEWVENFNRTLRINGAPLG
jgi:hypothetical protein